MSRYTEIVDLHYVTILNGAQRLKCIIMIIRLRLVRGFQCKPSIRALVAQPKIVIIN